MEKLVWSAFGEFGLVNKFCSKDASSEAVNQQSLQQELPQATTK